jgi:S-formylglutathione hydrolase FrmB
VNAESGIKPMTSEQLENDRMNDTTPVHRGYAYAALKSAFDQIQNPDNWKEAITAEIPAQAFDQYNAAAEFYTGAGLAIVGTFTRADGCQMVAVTGPGYYATVGA